MFVASGAVKDDFLVIRQIGQPGLELLEGDRALQLHPAAFILIGIGAYQEDLAGLNPRVDLLRGNAGRGGHNFLLL
jgi:hypothetical protein